jgi:hypothetical protein
MRKAVLVTLLAGLGASPAFAQTGNGAPSGPHYNLNIIGMSKGKTADMTGSERHTIFVALGARNDQVTSKIYLTPAEDFRVCDGNAFDPAFDCAGNQIASQGAVFELPCNTNLTLGGADVLVPCDAADPKLAYSVWARALGKPGGEATMTTCATDPELGDVVCSTENVLLVRNKGKSTFTNVTQQLTSLVACEDVNPDPLIEDIVCTRFALFSGDFQDWFWQYDNRGLRLAQVRFYPM